MLAFGILCSTAVSAGGFGFYVGQELNVGRVVKADNHSVDGYVGYDDVYAKTDDGTVHHMQALSFDPTAGEVSTLVYSKYSGYGATTFDSAVHAETAGYDVLAGVNCSFFALTGTSTNLYGGVTVSNGKVIHSNSSYPETGVMAIDKFGRARLVSSRVVFTASFGDGRWTENVECINVYPDVTYDVLYYFDGACGNVTDVGVAGVEVVFDKTDHGGLIIGSVLKGRVAKIRSVEKGGPIGEDQFVLYAKDGNAIAERLRSLGVGDEVEINVAETVEFSKETMENCVNAFPTYGYVMVEEGKNVTADSPLGSSHNSARGQRTALGIKPDGSMVIVTCDGRSEEYPGLNADEMADLLIKMGCVTAVNLDGGYSTQMVLEGDDGEIVAKTEQLRRVANSLLIVKRPAVAEKLTEGLCEYIKRASLMLEGYELGGEVDALKAAIEHGLKVQSDVYAVDRDYISAIGKLIEAMDGVVKLKYKPGIYSFESGARLVASVSSVSFVTGEIPAGGEAAVEVVSGSRGFVRYRGRFGWVDLEGGRYEGKIPREGVSIDAPEVLYPGEDLTVSWQAVRGATGYSYRITETCDEGDLVLAEAWSTDVLSVTVPSGAWSDGARIRLEVCAEFVTDEVWDEAYVTASLIPFRDVPLKHWGYKGVAYVYGKGIFTGVTDEVFDPNGGMTRAMMASVVYRMAGSPEVKGIDSAFTDIKKGSWYYDGVLWCQSTGIVNGVSADRFDPNGRLTREQTACFLYRFAEYLGVDVTLSDPSVTDDYADGGDVSRFAREAVAWIVENGIMQGSAGKLTPRGEADRVQIATLISKFCAVTEAVVAK